MVTKRQLGTALILVAILAVVGLIVVDLVGAGRWSGFGPLQWIGLALGAVAVGVGAVLVRLGDRPA